jgi:transposase InsO family protein
MLNWAYRNGVTLKLIEPGKPNQNAYVESFNGRLADVHPTCLKVSIWRRTMPLYKTAFRPPTFDMETRR